MLNILGVAYDQVWYKRPPFYSSNFSIPNGSASSFQRVLLEKINFKIISVQGCEHPHREHLSISSSITPSIALSIAPLDSFLPSKSGDKLSNQLARPLETKPSIADAPVAATNVF